MIKFIFNDFSNLVLKLFKLTLQKPGGGNFINSVVFFD
jgi:hypothetical protein